MAGVTAVVIPGRRWHRILRHVLPHLRRGGAAFGLKYLPRGLVSGRL